MPVLGLTFAEQSKDFGEAMAMTDVNTRAIVPEATKSAPAEPALTEIVHDKMRAAYRDDSTTQVVFENVKHFFWLAGNTVLCIAQYTDTATGEHRYINWPRERFCWFKDEKMPAASKSAEGEQRVGKYVERVRGEYRLTDSGIALASRITGRDY
jgi:hypothetical protein